MIFIICEGILKIWKGKNKNLLESKKGAPRVGVMPALLEEEENGIKAIKITM